MYPQSERLVEKTTPNEQNHQGILKGEFIPCSIPFFILLLNKYNKCKDKL